MANQSRGNAFRTDQTCHSEALGGEGRLEREHPNGTGKGHATHFVPQKAAIRGNVGVASRLVQSHPSGQCVQLEGIVEVNVAVDVGLRME